MAQLAKCPDCHKYWEENFRGEEYCPKCGQTKQDALKRIAAGKAKKPRISSKLTSEERQEQIIKEIKSHPLYGFAWRLTDYLSEQYDIPVHVSFGNRRNSEVTWRKGKKFQVRYGYWDIDGKAKNFCEYPSIAWVWGNNKKITGKKSVWAIVLHEFAHILQIHTVGYTYGESHKQDFLNALKELQTLVPFDDAQFV